MIRSERDDPHDRAQAGWGEMGLRKTCKGMKKQNRRELVGFNEGRGKENCFGVS